ncbi:MAG: flagellar protein FlaG [Pseudomonas sp.]|uniref:flagellar protein FlaG n=1 Tax=Pseudomonas sp. TaxID=306 RepID=UPI003391F840
MMDIGSIKDPSGPHTATRTARPGATTDPAAALTEPALAPGVTGETTAAAKPVEKPGEATREEVEGAVSTIQDFVQSVRRSINFSLEEGDGGRVVVKVTDAQSGDVIRQIPSEEALQLAENLSEVRSLLFKAEA